MKRYVSLAVLALLAVSVVAQTPKDWKMRIDHSANASDPDAAGDIQFVKTATGFHATNPRAAIFWNPANTVTGSYTLKGTFKLLRTMSTHTEYYGLVFGGSDLEGAGQRYLYFMVAKNGTWLIKKRDGDGTESVSAKTPSAAVKKPDASGKSTNALEVRVLPDKIEYFVNGTLVDTTPKTGLTAQTGGIYGIRINHKLEVQVDGFGVSKQ